MSKPINDNVTPSPKALLPRLAKPQSAARRRSSKPKPEFAQLTSDMSEEQMFNNLKAALIKSGFTVTKS